MSVTYFSERESVSSKRIYGYVCVGIYRNIEIKQIWKMSITVNN